MLSLGLLCAVSTHAASLSWDDGDPANSAWYAADNWNPNQGPTGSDNLTVGSGLNAALGSAFTITSGTLDIQDGGTVELVLDGDIRLSNNGAVSVNISGELNLNDSGTYLSTNVNTSATQGTFRLNGGSINISDWNNSLRSVGNANSGIGFEFMQAGDTINVSGISAAEQAPYLDKFKNELTFFGFRGQTVTWSGTANGAETQVHEGFKLVRTDDFANGNSTVTLVQVDPNFGPEKIVVYLLGGQSNCFGLGATSGLSSELQAPLAEVLFRYDQPSAGSGSLTTKSWIALQPGSGNNGGLGPEVLFGRILHEEVGSQETRIALVKYAKGGSSLFIDWAPGGNATTVGDGAEYVSFQNTVNSALSDLAILYPNSEISIKGMIWMQGENDARNEQGDAYQTNLNNFIADVRATYGADLPFVVGQLSDGQTDLPAVQLQKVQDAQAAVAAADRWVGLVNTNDLSLLSDNLHFNTAGQVGMGTRFAKVMLTLPLTDDDGNGLDDDWEENHWGEGMTGQDPAGDDDHDGWDNATEYAWDTDPLVSDGVGFTAAPPSGDMVDLSWTTADERRYMIEKSDDLINWTRVHSFIEPASAGEFNMPVETDGESKQFYRIGVHR
ncbi:hypothetical protein NT6N_20500 [Oceaniferula spumae]|uniref:Sialate O-acetylesterase domain-containing protein n=1 Tax=Oceaniferula spumae TaxID=2979115 RepID=A0AAT9FM09_9BACT